MNRQRLVLPAAVAYLLLTSIMPPALAQDLPGTWSGRMEPGNLSAELRLGLHSGVAGWTAELQFHAGADSSELPVSGLTVAGQQVRFHTQLEGADVAVALELQGGLLLGTVEVREGERVLAAGPIGLAPAEDAEAQRRLASWLAAQGTPVDAARRQAVIDRAAELFLANYVFADKAQQAVADLRQAAATAGRLDSITSAAHLADTLGTILADAAGDRHVRVKYSSEHYSNPLADDENISHEQFEQLRRDAAAEGFGLGDVRILDDNLGYLPLTRFFPAAIAGGALATAMAKLAPAKALIIDLRECRGGDPDMAVLVASWLFPPPARHWNDMERRLDHSLRQYWTAAWLPGPRFLDKPVYVLTAARTFSAPESLAYELQQTQRATIVGEPTGGGAHPGAWFPVADGFAIFIPLSRYVSAVSGGDWEGTGVIPDVPCAAVDALATARHRGAQLAP